MARIKGITFDFAGAFIPGRGISQAEFQGLVPRLEQVRDEVIRTDQRLVADRVNVPVEKQPLDAGFHEMPERILDAYQSNRPHSELGRILVTAGKFRERVDKVVVFGGTGSVGGQALMDACCQPYFNELSRAERGGRPRVYFVGNELDNDWTQGLLAILDANSQAGDSPGFETPSRDPDGRWGIVVIEDCGSSQETPALFPFLQRLERLVGSRLADYVIPVTGTSGKLASLADEIGSRDRFWLPQDVGRNYSLLSSAGLLPAAILGIDVVTLLEGAAAINSSFRTSPIGRNPVLDYAALNHLLEIEHAGHTREFSLWSRSLTSAGDWYEQLFAGSLATVDRGLSVVSGSECKNRHVQAQRSQSQRRSVVLNNVTLGSWRSEPLEIAPGDIDQAVPLKTWPEFLNASIAEANQTRRELGVPTTNLLLPAADEASLGQFFQMMMLATVVEARLIGINPYGQPTAEPSQKFLNQLPRQTVTSE